MIELTKNTIGIGVFGMKLKTKLPVLVPAIILAVLICAGITLYLISIFNEPAPSKQIVSATDKSELTIDIKTIEHEIKDIGNLCTSEYNFTAVDSFSKDKINLWFIKLPWTDSSAIVKYSGTITAGIDFTKVIVEENKFYYAYGSQCNEDWEVQYVIFFIWNGKIIVGEYFEDDEIFFYDIDSI